MKLFTIGYEGATQSDLIAALEIAGVRRLIDVRQLPLSRRPGFSKTPLKAALVEHGIEYFHLKPLSTPPEGREAARRGRHDEMAAIYRGTLAEPSAMIAIEQLRDLATELPSALLCFEREPAHCHRKVLIDEAFPEAEIEHLFAWDSRPDCSIPFVPSEAEAHDASTTPATRNSTSFSANGGQSQRMLARLAPEPAYSSEPSARSSPVSPST